MSKSGVGRGRGWLNLNKSQNPTTVSRIENISNPATVHTNSNIVSENQFVDAFNDFTDLINIVRQLNVNDDGIKFNQKIKSIVENWNQECLTSEEVEQSFDALYQACLNDAELASKLVIMIASRSFIMQEVREQNIRLMFLRKLQNNFEDCKSLHKSNPQAFQNSVRLLGEFYNKARLADGQQFTFMASPLISYLEMLLETAQPEDLQLFTTQLYLNGSSIKQELSEKVSELLNNIRLLLVVDDKLKKECKLWLLLALDVASNRFGILPTEIHKFYQDQLGDSAMASFQGTHGTLSVQTHDNKTLESYQSNVNVLQVSSTAAENASEPIPPSTTTEKNNTSKSVSSSSGFVSDTSSQNSSSTNRRDVAPNTGKNHGRPILGAGARLNKNRSNDQSNSNWRDKSNSSGWNSKQKSGWSESKNNSSKNAKGWDHDDRFENDYS